MRAAQYTAAVAAANTDLRGVLPQREYGHEGEDVVLPLTRHSSAYDNLVRELDILDHHEL
jgi:hypothetical protein